MCVARSMFSVSAVERAAWDAEREGWIVGGEWVMAFRRDGLARISWRSCFLEKSPLATPVLQQQPQAKGKTLTIYPVESAAATAPPDQQSPSAQALPSQRPAARQRPAGEAAAEERRSSGWLCGWSHGFRVWEAAPAAFGIEGLGCSSSWSWSWS